LPAQYGAKELPIIEKKSTEHLPERREHPWTDTEKTIRKKYQERRKEGKNDSRLQTNQRHNLSVLSCAHQPGWRSSNYLR
jgi:hypothetical protein